MKKWFMNLKIAHKFTVFLIISLIFTLIIGIAGCYFTENSKMKMESLYKNSHIPTVLLGQEMRHAHANRANILRLIVEQDKNNQQDIVKDINKRGKDFVKILNKVEKSKLDAKDKEDGS